MAKRMLIDATHSEETRAVVVSGNRLEEFDFETTTKKQLKGNIYLAKVTRVEPSLQAAFVDYGGNRHGFLAFSEIHPDYYRIPVADREALLAEVRQAESEIDDDEDVGDDDSDDTAAVAADAELDDDDDVDIEDDDDAVEAAAQDDEASEDDEPEEDDGDDEARPDMAAAEGEAPDDEAGGDESDGEETEDDTAKAPTRYATMAQPPAHSISETPGGAGEEHRDAAAEAEGDAPQSAGSQPETAHPQDAADEESAGPPTDDRDILPNDSNDYNDDDGDVVATGTEPGDDSPADDDETSARDADAGEETEGRRRGRRRRGRSSRSGAGNGDVEVVGGDEFDDFERAKAWHRRYRIQEVISRRQILLVQVAKEERGNKGAALTTYISLAGRYCVLMPNTPRGGGISRKIANPKDRRRLKEIVNGLNIPGGMAVIVRTAGAQRTKAEIRRDYDYLLKAWDEIRERTLQSTAPALIHEEGNLIKRSIRDLYTKDIDEVLVEGDEGYKTAKNFMKLLMPSHAKRVKAYKEEAIPLFHRYQVEGQIDHIHSPTVQLKSGGYIVLNATEALVAIDVNSGRSTRERNIEETAYRTNLEAADEIARQLRLRDLAGLVVIDFIDMEESRNRLNVERRLKEAMKHDRARIQLGRISPFGLLEMSRQRLRPSIAEVSSQPCPHCGGTGVVRSTESAALQILRGIEEEGMRQRTSSITVCMPPSVALYIMNHKRTALAEIEARFGLKVLVTVDDSLVPPDHSIELGPSDGDEEGDTGERQRAESSTGDDSSRSRRRRGRRRRGRDDDEVGADDTDDSVTARDADGDTDSGESDSEDSGSERRGSRRRGRRGGRRRSRREDDVRGADAGDGDEARTAATETVARDAADGEGPETGDAVAGHTAADEDGSEEGRRPGRRRRRRRPAGRRDAADDDTASEATAAADAAAAPETAPEPEPEPEPVTMSPESPEPAATEPIAAPSPAAGNGATPPSSAAADAEADAEAEVAEDAAEPDTPAEEPAAESVPDAAAAAETAADEKPKRRRGGWWSVRRAGE